jgi:hypothetical protein
MRAHAQSRFAAAGLVLGPLAWAASTQGNYILPDLVCGKSTAPVLGVSLALGLVAWLGAGLSLLAWRRARFDVVQEADGGRAGHLVAALGVGAGGLFGLVILMQGVAALVLSGCERW